MDEERQQQELVRTLRAFVDALRGAKSESQASDAITGAIRALCRSISGAEVPEAAAAGEREQFWRAGLVPALRRLSACMRRLDELEAARPKPLGSSADKKPVAPLGLLSLRDYAALQAALEVLVAWAAHPRVEAGVLLPVERRRPTKTLDSACNCNWRHIGSRKRYADVYA